MLGFEVSERTVSRWMRRAPRAPEPAKRWLPFIRNHREAIAAMDFFTEGKSETIRHPPLPTPVSRRSRSNYKGGLEKVPE
jgi:hypothetical protein